MNDLLAGITVLDFTRVLAGPYCTRLLADLGARVVKIERPGEGDEMRKGYLQLDEGRTDQSTYFIRINAGKHSVAIDLAHAEGHRIALDLARKADVVVENFLPGVVKKLGCDYPSLLSVKPDLVYCSISGFGQSGPLRNQQAFAHIVNAISGVMHLERQHADGAPRVGYLQTADVLAGTHAFGSILAALWRRQRTGQSAFLDVSMLECLISAEDVTYGAVLNGGDEYPGPRAGMIVHRIAGRDLAMQTVGAPQLWPRLIATLGRPELATDARFATPLARRENWPELRAIICAWLERFPSVDAAVKALTAERLPAAPVLSPQEVVAHPHLAERRAFAEVEHRTRGRVRVTGAPYHVDGRAIDPAGPAPYRAGEHTRNVLQEFLGYSPARIDELVALGAIEAA